MKTKYADLIKQLERVTEVYDTALAAVRKLERVTDAQEDVLGVYGGVNYHGEKFEEKRSIHLRLSSFMPVAMDCGYDFKMEVREDYTRFECRIFGYHGYRVFALFRDDEESYAELMKKVKADA